MTRMRVIAAIVGALALVPAAGFAATFNFAQMANSYMSANNYEGTWNQVSGGSGSLSDGGVTITSAWASWNGGTSSNIYPFFDSSYGMGGRDAGLGVCHYGFQGTTGRSACASGQNGVSSGGYTYDDNLTTSELLKLNFDQSVMLTGLLIRDANHYLIKNASNAIVINGHSYGTDSNGYVDLTGLSSDSIFSFATSTSCKSPEIYLSSMTVSTVPVPAGLALLPSAFILFGLLFGRRRPRAVAAA